MRILRTLLVVYVGALFVGAVSVIVTVGCAPKTPQEQRREEVIRLESAIDRVSKTNFVFYPPRSCWAVYHSGGGDYAVGSVSYVTCEVARDYMLPEQRKLLEDAEAKLGSRIP